MQGRLGSNLHIDALSLVTTLHLLTLCRLSVRLAHRRCPPPLPARPGGAPHTYSEASLVLIALLRTLWRLSYQDMRDWLRAWPALALACGLPLDAHGAPRIPSVSQQWKRGHRAGAPVTEALFFLMVRTAIRRRLIGARDLIIDSAPILAWRRSETPLRLSVMPRLSMPARSCAAIACIPCSVAAPVCPSSFCSHELTSMMRRLHARSWSERCISTTFIRA